MHQCAHWKLSYLFSYYLQKTDNGSIQMCAVFNLCSHEQFYSLLFLTFPFSTFYLSPIIRKEDLKVVHFYVNKTKEIFITINVIIHSYFSSKLKPNTALLMTMILKKRQKGHQWKIQMLSLKNKTLFSEDVLS